MDASRTFKKLEGADRGFARAIAGAALRGLGRIDWALGGMLDRPLEDIEPEVRALLRAGAAQLWMLGVADHADLRVLPLQRQILLFAIRRVGDEGRLVFHPSVGVAVAQFRSAQSVECLGVVRDLGGAEGLDVFRDRLLIRRAREGRDAEQSNRKGG